VWENHGKTQLDNLRNENEALKYELEAQQRRIMELQHGGQLAALQSAQLGSSSLFMPGMEPSGGMADPMAVGGAPAPAALLLLRAPCAASAASGALPAAGCQQPPRPAAEPCCALPRRCRRPCQASAS
jgi:hypothetical protein